MTEQDGRSIHIDTVHEDRSVDEEHLNQAIQVVLDNEDAELEYLGVILADHDTVRALNRRYLDHDYNTDVLSFPLRESSDDDRSVVNGEVYVDLDTAAERAPEFDAAFEDEVRRYLIHGLLHLIGYDDRTEPEQQQMRKREDRYLRRLSV